MEAVVQTLSDQKLRTFLEDGPELKDILRDRFSYTNLSEFIKFSLVAKDTEESTNTPTSKLTRSQIDQSIDILYHSSLNIIQLVHIFKNNNFKYSQEQYACNSEALKEILILKDPHNHQTIQLLCELSNQGKLDELLQLTQKSIDLVKVLNWISKLMSMLNLNDQYLHLNQVINMVKTVDLRQMFSSDHQWNVSDSLQLRINSLVHHIDHNKNGFVISLERLTQQYTLDTLSSTITEIEFELRKFSNNPQIQQLAQDLKTITIGLKSLQYFKNQGTFLYTSLH